MRVRIRDRLRMAREAASLRWWALASRVAYPVAASGCRVFFFAFARWEVRHADRLPATGPVIVIANHLSIIDPPIVVAGTRRKLAVMAKRELFEVFFAGGYFRAMGAFPVNRLGADIGALRTARNVLRNGGALVMFPEGTRSRGGGIRPALPGAAMVALMSGAPIVPCAITGSDAFRFPSTLWAWLRGSRPRITLDLGEPFHLPSDLRADAAGAERAIDFMMRRVADLLPEQYRGAYGRHSEGTIVCARHEGGTGIRASATAGAQTGEVAPESPSRGAPDD